MFDGYLRLVQANLTPINRSVPCQIEWRPDWQMSDITLDVYVAHARYDFKSGAATAKMGLFNSRGDLLTVLWPDVWVSNGTYTIKLDFDAASGRYSTKKSQAQRHKVALSWMP